MAENIITNADDVEVILSSDEIGSTRGSSRQYGRIVVDDFSLTREQDVSSESGVGTHLPIGLSLGDVELSFSFTMMGQDVDVFDMVADANGRSRPFSFTAKKTDDAGNLEWKYVFDTSVASSEEISASSGDPIEYAVEGMSVSYNREV